MICVMITLLLFICLWICTVKDLHIARFLSTGFILFVFVSIFFEIPDIMVGFVSGFYIGAAGYASFVKWPVYPENRHRTFKKRWIQHPAEAVLYRIFVWILRLLPLPVLSWLGGKIMEFIGPKSKRRAELLKTNLANIMPEHNNREFIRRVWNNWGRVFAEGLKLDSYKKKQKKYVRYKNRGLQNKYKQYIIAMPHTGNMGVMSVAFVGFPKKIAVTYKFPSNPLTNKIILSNYGYGQMDDVYFVPVGNAMPMVRALRDGHILSINPDQRVKSGETLDFMGRPARTSVGLATFARRFKLPILIAHVARTHGAHHEIIFDEFVDIMKTADDAVGMQIVNDAMARAIRKNPSEYLWMHRRWL